MPVGAVPAEEFPRAIVAGIFGLFGMLLGVAIKMLLAAVRRPTAGKSALEDSVRVIDDLASFSWFLTHLALVPRRIPADAIVSAAKYLRS